MNLKNKSYYLLLFIAVILLSSPHFFTINDLWDGAILRPSMKIGDFEMLYRFFNETNMTPYLIIYSFISYLTLIFNLEINLVINLFSVLIIFLSAFAFNLFLIDALKIEKNIALVMSILVALLPFYALLNSSLLFFSILNPTLIFLAIGIYYKKNNLSKIISLLLICYICFYPVIFPFVFFLLTISLIVNNPKIRFNKNYPKELLLYLSAFLGVILYMIMFSDVTGGYKTYPDINNIIFNLSRYNEYLAFFYPCLIIPLVFFVLNLFIKPLYTLMIIVACTALVIGSLSPYVYFNKSPICVIDTNCKSHIYDFKERHTIYIYFALMVIISIGLNFASIFNSYIKKITISLSTVILVYSLLPIHILNHNRNNLREGWMKSISSEMLKVPAKYNYVQILMPNDQILYRMRNYDIQYLASKVGIRDKIFEVNVVDSRVPNRKSPDYFVVPNEPDFKIKTKNIKDRIKNFGVNIWTRRLFVDEFVSEICAARYILSDSITKYDISYSKSNLIEYRIPENRKNFTIQDYFNVKLNHKSKWKKPITYPEVELKLLETSEDC
jgi:hypothetical protein